jgi:hypothetical protein
MHVVRAGRASIVHLDRDVGTMWLAEAPAPITLAAAMASTLARAGEAFAADIGAPGPVTDPHACSAATTGATDRGSATAKELRSMPPTNQPWR